MGIRNRTRACSALTRYSTPSPDLHRSKVDDKQTPWQLGIIRRMRLFCTKRFSGAALGILLFATASCTPAVPEDPSLIAVPQPDAHPANRGPGAPANTFTDGQLYEHCAYLSPHPDDADHHNLVFMYDGYLVHPFAPEYASGGGLAFWDVSDGCSPQLVGTSWDMDMRESHSIAIAHRDDTAWAVVNSFFGIQFWDVSDVTAPEPVTTYRLPGVFYPDAYARVIFSVFWQGTYIYAAGTDNGIFIVDASDPGHPELVETYTFDYPFRVAHIFAIGNLLVAVSTQQTLIALLDISNPRQPMPIPGGAFEAVDGDGVPREIYGANVAGNKVLIARKDKGGGAVIMDISDVNKPVAWSEFHTPGGNGGYVSMKDQFVFIGDSHWGAIVDFSDPASPHEVARVHLPGDLDTLTPIGNMVVASVDDPDPNAPHGQATAMIPFQAEPDTRAPHVTMVYPRDGTQGLNVGSRFGLVFNEMVDVKSVFTGSVTLLAPNGKAVRALYNVQENVVNLTPLAPLKPDTEYRLSVPAGGVMDYNGNRTDDAFTATFRTAPAAK
jgi:hypothetical protein